MSGPGPRLMGAALALALLPLAALHPVRIDGRSMEPGLRSGTLCLALRPWCAGTPARGQIWLVQTPAGPAVKRLVGIPGERLEIRDGNLWIDGVRLHEPYAARAAAASEGPWEAGAGLFFLGDNRDRSQDSRTWGAVSAASLRGRIVR